MDTPRWHQRFENFGKALSQLREAVDDLQAGKLNDLAKAGLIQRFEYTWELGWKSMRDYLSAGGIVLTVASPINVIRAGNETRLIADGDAWVEAMQARNMMSHEYDMDAFERVVVEISDRYLPMLDALAEKLEHERAVGN